MRKQLLCGGQIGLSAISYLGLAATTNTGCCLPCNNFWYKICERTDRDREDVEDAMTQPRIAVIDDDAAFLEMIDTMLTDAGYQTLLSSDGRTAYTLIRQHQPNLVILDLRMEHPQAGWIIMHMLRVDPQTAHIPVLMCSGDQEYFKKHAARFREYGCAMLLKPFSVDDLLTQVMLMLEDAPRQPSLRG